MKTFTQYAVMFNLKSEQSIISIFIYSIVIIKIINFLTIKYPYNKVKILLYKYQFYTVY